MAVISEDQQMTCGACPVQIEGALKDGRRFYFRARGERAQLGVGHTDEDAVHATIDPPADGLYVERDLSHLGPFGAGWIGVHEAYRLLHELAAELPDVTA